MFLARKQKKTCSFFMGFSNGSIKNHQLPPPPPKKKNPGLRFLGKNPVSRDPGSHGPKKNPPTSPVRIEVTEDFGPFFGVLKPWCFWKNFSPPRGRRTSTKTPPFFSTKMLGSFTEIGLDDWKNPNWNHSNHSSMTFFFASEFVCWKEQKSTGFGGSCHLLKPLRLETNL